MSLTLMNGNGGTSTVFRTVWAHGYVSLHTNEHVSNPAQALQLSNLNVLGHLVDFLIDDGLLCFNRVDDVLNMRVYSLFRFFSHVRNRHLNDLLIE